VLLTFSYYNHDLLKFSNKIMFKIQPIWNILFINFSYIKISCILCVACYKLNGMPHCLIMKVKKVLNNFFSCLYRKCDYDCIWDILFDILYHAYALGLWSLMGDIMSCMTNGLWLANKRQMKKFHICFIHVREKNPPPNQVLLSDYATFVWFYVGFNLCSMKEENKSFKKTLL